MAIPMFTKVCPEGVVEAALTVSEQETDAAGRMELSALARHITDLAFDHLEKLGFDREQMTRAGKLWMVVWNQMEIRRMPRCGEELLLRVWAGKRQSIMHSRKFAIYTKTGEELGAANSLLSVIDAKTRMMSQDTEEFRSIPVVKLENEPGRVPMFMDFPEQYAEAYTRAVQPFMIDPNGHMNNSFYFDWAQEDLPADFAKTYEPSAVWVEYRKELLLGQTARITRILDQDTLYVKGMTGEELSFSIKIDYRKSVCERGAE